MTLEPDDFDRLVIEEYPYPVAVNYQRLLDADNWEYRTRKVIELFEYGLRTLTLSLISQYLIDDIYEVNNDHLNSLLLGSFHQASLGTWVEVFFKSLAAYENKQNLLFTPEIYEVYWDTANETHKKRAGVRYPFQRLTEIRNDLAHRITPEADASWQAIGQEALGYLQQVLSELTFIRRYDLIRVTEEIAQDRYRYKCYTGCRITDAVGQIRVVGSEKVRVGWFYLRRNDDYVMRLHPLLILWVAEGQQPVQRGARDVAIYSRFLKESVEYDAIVERDTLREDDIEIVALFRQLLDYNLGRLKISVFRKKRRLSWETLRDVALELSAKRMGALSSKYSPRLYLQRNETLEQFRDFLASEKTVFALIGKSGVGKSNFVLSLADEFTLQRDTCFLLYDAARLIPQASIASEIADDIVGQLGLAPQSGKNLFDTIDSQISKQDKKLVIVFDGINENDSSRELLRQVDKFAEDNSYPWLKVVVTSRPESWRISKRGLHLAEHLYYEAAETEDNAATIGDLAVTLDRFNRLELEAVYGRYKETYGLLTDFVEISAVSRERLRDPLVLWLVAETFREGRLPPQIHKDKVYDLYIDALLASELLFQADLALLRTEIMPLMIYEGHYENTVVSEQIYDRVTSDNRRLWEILLSPDVLSNGEPVNASYARLKDAEILVVQGERGAFELSFKYERFYDYFGGKRLAELFKALDREEKSKRYKEILGMLNEKPFLFGVLKTALKLELEMQTPSEVFLELAYTEDHLSRDLLAETLAEYGEDHDPMTVKPILEAMLVVQPGPDVIKARTPKRICVRVARQLMLADLLIIAALSNDETLRRSAAMETYYLWRADHNVGIQVLEEVAAQVRGRLSVPNRGVLEFCITVSLLILFWHKEEQEELLRLRAIWREIFESLRIAGPNLNAFYKLRREAVIYFVVGLATNAVGKAQAESYAAMPTTVPEISAFFTLTAEEKAVFRKLVPYMDAEQTGIEEAYTSLERVAEHRDVLSMYLMSFVLLAHLTTSPRQARRALEAGFNRSLKMEPAGPGVPYASLVAIYSRHYVHEFDPEMTRFLAQIVETNFIETGGYYVTALEKTYRRIDAARCSVLYASITGEWPNVAHEFLDTVLATRPLSTTLLLDELLLAAGAAIDAGWFRIQPLKVFEFFDLVLEKAHNVLDKETLPLVTETVARALGMLKSSFENEVDDYLHLRDFSERDRLVAMTRDDQTLGDLLSRVSLLGTDMLVTDMFPGVRQDVMWLLERATYSDSAAPWLRTAIKWLINTIYGDEVFELDY